MADKKYDEAWFPNGDEIDAFLASGGLHLEKKTSVPEGESSATEFIVKAVGVIVLAICCFIFPQWFDSDEAVTLIGQAIGIVLLIGAGAFLVFMNGGDTPRKQIEARLPAARQSVKDNPAVLEAIPVSDRKLYILGALEAGYSLEEYRDKWKRKQRDREMLRRRLERPVEQVRKG